MEKSESIKNLASALCKFQGEVEKIKKSEVNPFFKSKYADLSAILDVIRHPLCSNGLSFVQFPKDDHVLETMLMHESGEWMSESYRMNPVKNDPQGLGSVITYQRRYALGAILGLNIDIDDDANSHIRPSQPPVQKQDLPPVRPQTQIITDEDIEKAIEDLESSGTLTELGEKWKKYKLYQPFPQFLKRKEELKQLLA